MIDSSDAQSTLIESVKKKQWYRVEEQWLDLIERPSEDLEFYNLLAGTIARNGGTHRLPDLWELLLGYFIEQKKYPLVLELARIALKYAPDVPNLHPAVLEVFKDVHKDCQNLERYIRESGLREKFNLADSLARCEEFLYFDEGEIFQHVTWGIGKVVALDSIQNRLTIKFGNTRHKSFTFEGAHQFLTKLPHNHFLAFQETDLGGLKEKAATDPVALVKLILKSYNGRITLPELKLLLTEKVMTEKEFAKWWNKIKKGLRNDPWIEIGAGARPRIRLRSEPKSYLEELLERFEKAATVAKKRLIVKEMAQHQKGKPLETAQGAPFDSRIRKWHSACEVNDLVRRLQLVYMIEEFGNLMNSPPAPLEDTEDSILREVQNPVSFLSALEIFDYECRALERLLVLQPTDSTKLLKSLYLDAPTKLGQYAFEKLLGRKEFDAASKAIRILLEQFARNPETYVWTVRQILKERGGNVDPGCSELSLLVDSLHHLEAIRHGYDTTSADAETNRQLQSRLRALFTGEKCALLASVLKELPAADARRLHNSLFTSPAFIASAKESMDNVFRKVRRDIFEQEEEAETTPRVHYCTAEELKKKQDELRHIRSVEIPRITREIETARAHGDISENAEYDAAKEHQALLFQRMEELQNLIARARIINLDSIQTAQISIGTRFKVRKIPTGEVETYTLLGTWEANPEEDILSYLSPFGSQFLGKKIGETLKVEHPGGGNTRYEILSIENAQANTKEELE